MGEINLCLDLLVRACPAEVREVKPKVQTKTKIELTNHSNIPRNQTKILCELCVLRGSTQV